ATVKFTQNLFPECELDHKLNLLKPRPAYISTGAALSITVHAPISSLDTTTTASGIRTLARMHRRWATGTRGCSTSRIHQRSCRAGTSHIRPRIRKRTAGTFHTRSYRCTPRRSTGADRRAALLFDERRQRSLGLGDAQSPRWRCPETATRFLAA